VALPVRGSVKATPIAIVARGSAPSGTCQRCAVTPPIAAAAIREAEKTRIVMITWGGRRADEWRVLYLVIKLTSKEAA
jgi:hypothetical protein